ncbi:unnamed protein product [Cuscuta epithymum]|uniref:Methyltransferase type 11 domain-containing protein n=1 Tax=Cuscuta epithymum TaxID=186058 RepID=A0AAV0F190_9ASTE|nr:unnamed protein product [Cuscuta epithymum]
MDTAVAKPNRMGNILVKTLSFGVLVFLARFAYFITTTGNTYDSRAVTDAINTAAAVRLRDFYSSLFHDLIAEGFLSLNSRTLCIGTLTGEDVATLREIGVADSIGIAAKSSPPLVRHGHGSRIPFKDEAFDFIFSGNMDLERSDRPIEFAKEVSRTLKPGGFFVVLTSGTDLYSLNSLLALFNSCRAIRTSEIDGIDFPSQNIREVVLMKDNSIPDDYVDARSKQASKCSAPGFMHELIRKAEPLIAEEPLKPWVTFRRNLKNITYLSSIVDISFKHTYIYIDVGSRNYASSIGNWFKKHYPKQNKPFQIYAIEADSTFHDEYRTKKGVTLLPYAAWIRNETLFFEITREPNKNMDRSRGGMGRIQTVQSSLEFTGKADKIQGFDFAKWLKGLGLRNDYVVMKMDVEGTEFHLIPRMIESGVMCLVDELFLECHYSRWQRCCPGVRSPKYQKTYDQCLALFSSLRERGVFVHQWW